MVDPTLVPLAESIARHAHAGQRYGDLPYVSHLQDVVDVLQGFAPDRFDLHAAGWLHDALEDTDETTTTLLKRGVPGAVVHLVDACTDNRFGSNRAARKERPYLMIQHVPDALLVKLADRIANVESAVLTGKAPLLEMYRRERADFRARLYGAPTTIGAGPLWKRLGRALAGGGRDA